MRRLLFLLTLWSAANVVSGQSEETVFVWEASTAVNYKLGKSWSFNTSLATRTILLHAQTLRGDDFRGELNFGEVNQFATYRINPRLKASIGYKYRIVEPTAERNQYEHRVTQQVAWLHRPEGVRMASRGRVEQRIRNGRLAHRFRYRFSVDFPLSGQALDAREFYMLASNEILYESTRGNHNTWGNRFSTGVGYLFGPATKLQFTAIYRSDDINLWTLNRLFVETSLFINL